MNLCKGELDDGPRCLETGFLHSFTQKPRGRSDNSPRRRARPLPAQRLAVPSKPWLRPQLPKDPPGDNAPACRIAFWDAGRALPKASRGRPGSRNERSQARGGLQKSARGPLAGLLSGPPGVRRFATLPPPHRSVGEGNRVTEGKRDWISAPHPPERHSL